MKALKRSIAFGMLKRLIRPGNVTIIDGGDFLVPPRRTNYQQQGYNIAADGWSQDIIVLPIDGSRPYQANAASVIRGVLGLMGYQVSPIMLTYGVNTGDCPQSTQYTTVER